MKILPRLTLLPSVNVKGRGCHPFLKSCSKVRYLTDDVSNDAGSRDIMPRYTYTLHHFVSGATTSISNWKSI